MEMLKKRLADYVGYGVIIIGPYMQAPFRRKQHVAGRLVRPQ